MKKSLRQKQKKQHGTSKGKQSLHPMRLRHPNTKAVCSHTNMLDWVERWATNADLEAAGRSEDLSELDYGSLDWHAFCQDPSHTDLYIDFLDHCKKL